MTDPTYNDESHHITESRDARIVGHDEAVTSKERVERHCAKIVSHVSEGRALWDSDFGGIIDTLRALLAERDTLKAENEVLTTSSISEVATRNPSTMGYMQHWERRAEVAEAEVEKLREENKRLLEAAKPFDDAARDRAAEAPEWCVNDALAIWVKIGDLRNLRAALKGDSHD